MKKRRKNKNNNGYIGQRMSVRAMEAYENGEMPLSKWSKQIILNVVLNLINELGTDAINFDFENLKKLKHEELKQLLLMRSSWHHTGKFFNETSFYEIDKGELAKLTNEKIQNVIANRAPKETQKEELPNLFITAFVKYITWERIKRYKKRIVHKEIVHYRSNEKLIQTKSGRKRLTSLEILNSVSEKTKFPSDDEVLKQRN